MRLFVPLFFLFYSLVHYYAYRKVSGAFSPGRGAKVILLLILAFTTLSPALFRVLDRSGYLELSRPLAFISLFWMGFILYFFLVGVLIDLYRRFGSPDPRRAFLITLSLALLLSAYSHAETYLLQVYRFTIETPKLPPGKEIKVLHISDMHLGPVMREDRIEMVRRVYEREKPDLIVATGDMVDGNMRDSERLAKLLSEISPPLGKFAVLGNHEFYVGPGRAIEFLEKAGFRVLRGEVTAVGGLLNIAGVDDPDGEKLGYKAFTDELEVLKRADSSRYTILIKHRPEVKREALPYLDLVLAGHTHGGVLFFIGYTVLRAVFETDRGIKEIAPSKFIVVSKGLGTGGPPMRLLSPPDVVVVTIRGED
ncbi:metallophosphoesterase [Hydrogenivirga sp.]